MSKGVVLYKGIGISVIAFFIGLFAYANATHFLMNFNLDNIFSTWDIASVVFINKSFSEYEFLDQNNMFLYMNLFIFMVVGLIIECSSFLLKSNMYHSFIYLRYKSVKKARIKIRQNSVIKTTCYAIFYFLGVYVGCQSSWIYSFNQIEGKLFLGLIANLIVKIILIEVISQFVFIMYLKKDAAIAFLSGVMLIFLFIIMDLGMQDSYFILFNEAGDYLFSGIILLAIKWILNKISYCWLSVNTVSEGEYI